MTNSTLMIAGDKEKHLIKIKNLQCHIAIINLEDGVFDKDKARDMVVQELQSLKCKNKQIVVRINDLKSCGKMDIEALNKVKPDAIRIPKVKTIEDIKLALKLIDKEIDIHLSIETKQAFENLSKFKIDNRITTVYLGILDLLESLSLPQSLLKLDNPTIDYILSKFLIDSHIAGLKAVSFTYQDYKNTQEFSNWCKKEKEMGYSCKSCINPTQVQIANKIFGINKDDILKAAYIKDIFEKQKLCGCTGFSDEKYGFIDEPIYKDSLLVLKLNKS